MQTERRRIARLQRLERVRAIARQTAAAEVALAEGTLAQLRALAGRTAALAQDYAARSRMSDGFELAQQARFAAELQGISTATAGDARAAQDRADRAQHELAQAERRRAAVDERAVRAARDLAARSSYGAAGARRAIGTALEKSKP